jgi:hypothetical protein
MHPPPQELAKLLPAAIYDCPRQAVTLGPLHCLQYNGPAGSTDQQGCETDDECTFCKATQDGIPDICSPAVRIRASPLPLPHPSRSTVPSGWRARSCAEFCALTGLRLTLSHRFLQSSSTSTRAVSSTARRKVLLERRTAMYP